MVNEEGCAAGYPATAGAFFVMLAPFAEGLVVDWWVNVGLNLTL